MIRLISFLLLISATATFSQSVNLQNGLLLYLPFCGSANDASGNSNTINVNGATLTTDRLGNPNSAYRFDGIDDFISIVNAPNMKPSYPFSFSCWVKLISSSSEVNLLFANDYTPPGDTYYGTYFSLPSSRLAANVGDGGFPNSSSRRSKQATSAISLGNWVHLAAVVNSQSDMKLYYGNIETGGTYSGLGAGLIYSTTGNAVIGKGNGGFGENFINADIDEIRFYNRALNQNEINALANYVYLPEPVSIGFNQSVICQGEPIEVYALPNTLTSVNWSNGETSDTISVEQPLNLILEGIDFCGISQFDTLELSWGPCLQKMNLGEDKFICSGLSVFVNGTVDGAVNYSWNDSENSPIREFTSAGTYIITAENECYSEKDTIEIFEGEIESIFNFENDTSICYDDTLTFVASETTNSTTIWSDGTEGNTIQIFEPGIYWVKSIGACGISRDTLFVSLNKDCGIITKVTSDFSMNAQHIKNYRLNSLSALGLSNHFNITLYDLNGKLIGKNLILNEINSIELSNGQYFYILKDETGFIQNGRIILTKQ
jgi:Concanavalin A-like lectin/glucanases superfamily